MNHRRRAPWVPRRLVGAVAAAGVAGLVAGGGMAGNEEAKTVAGDVLIEWTKVTGEAATPAGGADITVFTDGRIRYGPRLGGGHIDWSRLSPAELEDLRQFVFQEQRLMDINNEALADTIAAARSGPAAGTDPGGAAATFAPQMDAGVTVIHADIGERSNRIRFYDVFGNAMRHPEVEALQRLRAIELRLLEIARSHTPPAK